MVRGRAAVGLGLHSSVEVAVAEMTRLTETLDPDPERHGLYDRLFQSPDPDEADAFLANLNPNSLEVLATCYVEPSLKDAAPGQRYQFERNGYVCVDPDSADGKLVFNRTVSLKDTWAKIDAKQGQ